MVTYTLHNVKRLSWALSLGLLLSSSLQAHLDPFSIDLERTNLIGPKNLKPMKQPKYDWMKKDPKDSSNLSSPKIVNPIPSSKIGYDS